VEEAGRHPKMGAKGHPGQKTKKPWQENQQQAASKHPHQKKTMER